MDSTKTGKYRKNKIMTEKWYNHNQNFNSFKPGVPFVGHRQTV